MTKDKYSRPLSFTFFTSSKELQKTALHGKSESSFDGRRSCLVRMQSRRFPNAIAKMV